MAEISKVMLFCEKYYSKKKFLHVLRAYAEIVLSKMLKESDAMREKRQYEN